MSKVCDCTDFSRTKQHLAETCAMLEKDPRTRLPLILAVQIPAVLVVVFVDIGTSLLLSYHFLIAFVALVLAVAVVVVVAVAAATTTTKSTAAISRAPWVPEPLTALNLPAPEPKPLRAQHPMTNPVLLYGHATDRV